MPASRRNLPAAMVLLVLATLCACNEDSPVAPVTLTSATIPVDLPGLAGAYSLGGSPPYPAPSTRTFTFRMPDEVRSIRELRMSLLGTWESGQRVICRPIGPTTRCDTFPQYIGVTMRLTAASLGECSFEATAVVPVDFGNPAPFVASACSGSADINLLLGQQITVEISCVPGDWPVADLVGAAVGTLNAVGLEVDGEVPYVADIHVEPNPATYEALQEYATRYPDGDDPTGLRIEFVGLPPTTGRITIRDQGGELVREFAFDGAAGRGYAKWDLRTGTGMRAPTGIYFYTVHWGDGDAFAAGGAFFASPSQPE